MTDRSGPEVVSLAKLRALVLLAGAVRPGRLGVSIGRPVFELPLERSQSILDHWRAEAATLGALSGGDAVAVRVMIDQAMPEPAVVSAPGSNGLAAVRIERDPFDYRGTGGVLHDLAGEYGDDDLLLVANAAQVLMEPLVGIVKDLAATGGDVSIISHLDGTASGMMLVRCGALRELPGEGFIDMKEQGLSAIAAGRSVMVVHREHPTALPVRTLLGYIEALRAHHRRLAGKAATAEPFAENWESAFAIVEEGALVEGSARLHESAVLRGGRVEANAVLVHSVVCPSGVLRRGKMTVDDFVAAGGSGRTRR
jgi:hypothetical protein